MNVGSPAKEVIVRGDFNEMHEIAEHVSDDIPRTVDSKKTSVASLVGQAMGVSLHADLAQCRACTR